MKKTFYSLFFILLFSGSTWAQIAGERTVPSDDYPDLQTVADSLNLYGVGTGGVSFMLQGGTTFEESPIEFTTGGTADAPVYIGWDGEGEKPTVNFDGTESERDAGFKLTGVSFITLDGINITNPNSNLEVGILITNYDGANGSSDNTIKNVDITLDKLNEFSATGISVVADSIPSDFMGNNHNNKFYNNRIFNVGIGYSFDGNTSTTDLMSVGNEVGIEGDGESLIQDLVLAGVTARDQNGFNFSHTTIRDLLQTESSSPAAISTSSGNPSDQLTNDYIISHNTIENLSCTEASIFGMYISARKVNYYIHNNKIHNVTSTAGGGATADGIMVLATSVDVNIYNNMISGIAAPASAVNNNTATRGIQVRTYEQANIFYNTVVLEYTATNTAHRSAALSIYNNSKPVQMRNNILINKTILPAESDGIVTAVYKRNNTWAGLSSTTDNNIYYAGVPGPQNVIYYGHNSTTPNVHQTLEDYKLAADSLDQNSHTEDVQFVDFNDLHVVASANTLARNNAIPINDPIIITTDFDGTTRDTATPDIGADEIASASPDVAINPNPADGETEVSLNLSEISWEYITSPEYTTPAGFMVYMSTSAEIDETDLIATVTWEADETNYSAVVSALNSMTDYYWMVVPTTDLVDGSTPEEVDVWTFKTEMYIFPYPNAAENPTPEDEEVIILPNDHTITFGWDYNPEVDHVLPTEFLLFGASDMSSEEWDTPIAEINFEEGQVSYEIEITDHPNFTYELATSNFWKIVPVSSDFESATPDVPVWSFSFDENTGLNDLSLEGTIIFPNPAVDVLNIEPGFDGKYEVMLYDVQGRLVKNFGENEGIRSLNISSVQSGAYQVVIIQGEARSTSLIKVN